LTENEIICLLQMYKGLACCAVEGYATLQLKNGKIEYYKEISGSKIDSLGIRGGMKYREVSTQAKALRKIGDIDRILAILNDEELKVIFYKIIQHDFEVSDFTEEGHVIYKTLPYRQKFKKKSKKILKDLPETTNRFTRIKGLNTYVKLPVSTLNSRYKSAMRKLKSLSLPFKINND